MDIMVFYFSGTGNSAKAAQLLCGPEEQVVNMARTDWNTPFAPAEGEAVGFVFPVYFYGLPDTVRRFAAAVQFARKPAYVYAVITCGGSIAGAGELLGKALAQHGTALRAVYSVKMPDNYVLMYDVTSEEAEKPILERAYQRLTAIRTDIENRRFCGTNPGLGRVQTAAIYPFYDLTRKTAKFHTDERCTGCGACAARCPAKAIEMQNGRPVWVKESCDHCLSCLRCNAVQFGKRTVGRRRYLHPDLRKPERDC